LQTNEFDYFQNDDFQAIDLPYGNEQFRMTILLPKPPKNIDSLIEELDEQNWRQWLTNFSADSAAHRTPRRQTTGARRAT
jgi:serpin B